MWRALASNMITVLSVALFLLAGLVLWGKAEYTGAGPHVASAPAEIYLKYL